MKNKYAWLILCMITVVAGLALSLTNMVTEGPIAEQKLKASNAARAAVFADADGFTELAPAEGSKLDSVYTALKGGQTVGYVLQATVSGYGGPIEIVLGVDNAGVITGISVGGSNFSETAGLGTRTREPEFTGQFIGLGAAPELGANIDGISGATISSSAVVSGAKRCYAYWQTLAGVAAPEATKAPLTAANVKTVTVQGYESEFDVTVGFDGSGVIQGVQVGGDGFAETEGLGARVLEASFLDQFSGKTAPVRFGEGIDAIAGATISSNAVLRGVNEAMGVSAETTGETQQLDTPDASGAVSTYSETVQGYAGEIVVTVGLAADGTIASLSIGGPNFNETEYYGAEAQTNAFRNQFIGKSGQLTYGKDVDAISSATVTSNAVLAAINHALAGGGAAKPAAEPTVETLTAPDSNGAVKIVTETVQDFKNEIVVKVGLTADGAIASLSIGGPSFDETEYYGAEVQTNAFRNQFIGKSGQLAYGTDVDAVASATITSNAVLKAINDALTR